jgi:hypothetical protein
MSLEMRVHALFEITAVAAEEILLPVRLDDVVEGKNDRVI